MKKLTIYCGYHLPEQIEQYKLKKTNNFVPFDLTDTTLKTPNINYLNPFFSEFCMHYWTLKNDINSEYIGCCHYRRQIPPNTFIENMHKNGICQVYETQIPNPGIFGMYKWSRNNWLHCEWFFDDYCEYIRSEYPNDADLILSHNNDNFLIGRGSFILQQSKFVKLCNFLFNFFYFEMNKYGIKPIKINEITGEYIWNPDDIYNWLDEYYIKPIKKDNHKLPFNDLLGIEKNKYRLFAYAFEYMTSIWLAWQFRTWHVIYNNVYITNAINYKN